MQLIDERTTAQAVLRPLESLKTTSAEGSRPSFLFFYGHSQWWPSSFMVEGDRYATAEHFMMAHKARLFGDQDAFARILVAPHRTPPKRRSSAGR